MVSFPLDGLRIIESFVRLYFVHIWVLVVETTYFDSFQDIFVFYLPPSWIFNSPDATLSYRLKHNDYWCQIISFETIITVREMILEIFFMIF